MRYYIILLLMICMAMSGHGQNDRSRKQSSLFLSLGLNPLSLKDQTFSPTVFSGATPIFRLGYNQIKEDERQWNAFISISVGNIDVQNRYFPSTYASAEFTFNHLWPVKSFEQSKVFFGGQFTSQLNVLDYDGFVSGSWFTAQKLEPVVRYTHKVSEKHSISGQLSHPVISLVSRPGYAGVDEFVVINSDNIPKILYSRMEVYSINRLINPNVSLTYSYEKQNITTSLLLSYNYLQVNSVRRYFRNEYSISFLVAMKIGGRK